MNMFYATVTFILCITFLQGISSENLNGIYLIDSCKCNSSKETCDPNGPFMFDQQRSTLSIKYGSTQVGVGTLGNDQVDIYLNQNRCKGLWNRQTHVAELTCLHQNGIICSTNMRCILGSCLDNTTTTSPSSSLKLTMSFLLMISLLIMLV